MGGRPISATGHHREAKPWRSSGPALPRDPVEVERSKLKRADLRLAAASHRGWIATASPRDDGQGDGNTLNQRLRVDDLGYRLAPPVQLEIDLPLEFS